MKTLQKILVLYNKPENINDESDLDTQNSAFEVAKQLTGEGFVCGVMGIGLNEVDKVKNL